MVAASMTRSVLRPCTGGGTSLRAAGGAPAAADALEYNRLSTVRSVGRVSWTTRRFRLVSASAVGSALVAAEGMVVGDLHDNDSHAVGICDPHLDQAPRLPSGRLCHRHAGGGKPIVLHGDVPHL